MTELTINRVPIDDPSITVDENGIDISRVEFVHTASAPVVKTPDGYYYYHDPDTWAHLVGPYDTAETAIDEFKSRVIYYNDGDDLLDYDVGTW